MKVRASATREKKERFRFVGDTVAELKKVVWPTRQEVMRLSIMVLVICLTIGLILGAIDYGFTELIKRLFFQGG